MPFGYAATTLGQVHYRREGTGAPLLLLAASGRSSLMYEGLVELLTPHFDVCALDTLGFGNSGPLPPGATIEQLAECVAEVLDGTGIARCHIHGLHTGNRIGTAFAGRWPARVDRLVLAGQSHSLIPDNTRRNDTILGIVSAYFEPPAAGPCAGLADWVALYRRMGAIWLDHSLLASGATAEDQRIARNMALDELLSVGTAELYRANFAYDLRAGLTAIRVPTTVLEIATPDEDRTIGRQGEAVLRLIPGGATLHTLHEPRGHTLTLENRARDVADILIAALRPATEGATS